MKAQNTVSKVVGVGLFLAWIGWGAGLVKAAPANDFCEDAQEIFDLPFFTEVDNSTATEGTPVGSCNSSSATVTQNDVWYKFVPRRSDSLTFTVEADTYDTVVTLYSGADCANLTEVACGDDPEPVVMNVSVTKGTTYWLQVGDWGTAPGGGVTPISVEATIPEMGPADLVSKYLDYVQTWPIVDGTIAPNEWAEAATLETPWGQVRFMHYLHQIYLLIDVIGDTLDDGPDDFFWLTFDVNEDGLITPNEDLMYSMYPNTTDLGIQYYQGPGHWSGLNPSTSVTVKGFGPTMNSGVDHTYWEVEIPFTEIAAGDNEMARMGMRVHSDSPVFTWDIPSDHVTNFTDLIDVLWFTPGQKILDCYSVGSGGANASHRGIRLSTDRCFNNLQLRMMADMPGGYRFNAEIRRGYGFTAEPVVVVPVEVNLPFVGMPPYAVVEFGFPLVEVRDFETFTLKLADLSGSGTAFVEATSIGSFPCGDMVMTTDNSSSNPDALSAVMGLKLFAKECYHVAGGDVNGDCRTDLADLALMSASWLDCYLYPATLCEE